ncbi:uncharacterized protein LOC135224925 [Macrobrachium nipponense]|uniref:uncharacterized protein LOC135224925 n=1 Tax=Macrobrachium nipponense TaxID=159736 RepID=UPI0030C7BE54
MASRKTSLGATFILVLAFTSAEEVTSAGDSYSSSGGRNSELAATQCPEKCEINLAGRTCKLNHNCLMEILHSHRDTALEQLPEGGDGDEQCGGQCYFQDKQGKCRLDLLCILDGDFAETCRFLSDCDIPAFSASDERGHCSSSNTESDCADTGPSDSRSVDVRFGITSITDPPNRPCPGKCMVRDSQGNCVVNFDCASMEP